MFVQDEALNKDRVWHGFFGRQGGVSKGIYSTLNCGLGTQDELTQVMENRRRVTAEAEMRPENLVTVRQVHSRTCITVEEPFANGQSPEADAIVTARSGIMLGVLTADCAPVLFHGIDRYGSPVIGAAHAGWGGAFKGVLESTVNSMMAQGVALESMTAVIGPCIAQKSYEVTQEFVDRFLEQSPAYKIFFINGEREGHFHFDLIAYVHNRLKVTGVGNISSIGHDTYAMEGEYFSYRRSCHRNEPDYGRQISVIAIL